MIFFFFLPCRARHDSSDGRSRLHTIRTQLNNRDMSDLEATKKSIPHWPPAAAWWASRVPLVGPYCERTEVVCIRICEETGLSNVHPTWAGTFVLAGMVALYPNIHFALIDNDCLPLTLFEITELWHLADEGGGGRRSEGRRGLHLRKASRGLEGGLKPSG